MVNFLARISRSLSISPLLGRGKEPYIRDEHRSIATAYFECPGTLDMKVLHLASGEACSRQGLRGTRMSQWQVQRGQQSVANTVPRSAGTGAATDF